MSKYIKLVAESIQEYNNMCSLDYMAEDFLKGNISESELFNYCTSLNEGKVSDAILYAKDKILNVLFTFMQKSKNISNKVLSKVLSFISKIMGWLKKFQKKHPILSKAIFIFIIFIIIMLVTTQSAQAVEIVNNNIKLDDTDILNTAYGFIDANYKDLLSSSTDNPVDAEQIATQAKMYLKDIQDGKMDLPTLKKESIALAKAAISTVNDLVNKVNDTQDTNLLTKIIGFMKQGMSHTLEITKNVGDGYSNIQASLK